MLTLLESLLVNSEVHNKPCLDYLLEILAKEYQGNFCTFADCGGGVGSTAVKYLKVLESSLSPVNRQNARVVCYEPLPENLVELNARVAQDPRIVVRPVAVSEFQGYVQFVIPKRMAGNADTWGPGTSSGGYISQGQGDEANKRQLEQIQVGAVRLENEPYERFDFVKMDLQGGEHAAILGLGKKLSQAKLLFVEQQLLGKPEAPDPMPLDILRDAGFICFYDEVQFGLYNTIREIPFGLLAEGGLQVSRIIFPDGRGFPFSGRARFTARRSVLLQPDGKFSGDYIKRLKSAGIPWMATDILAIHKDVFVDLSRLL